MIDLYTKTVLTVIAVALVGIAAHQTIVGPRLNPQAPVVRGQSLRRFHEDVRWDEVGPLR